MNQQFFYPQRLCAICRRGGWLFAVGLTLVVLAFFAGDTAWAGTANAPLGQTTPSPSSPFSDDFNACTLDARWQYTDPLGDSKLEVNGEQVVITVPAGVTHDIWEGNMNAPRLLQTVNNIDFDATVKFESSLKRRYQLQGLLAQADADNLLRFNFQSDGSSIHLLVVSFSGGSPTIIADETIADGTPLYMRVQRSGNNWTISYSYDGSAWQSAPSLAFTQSLALTKFGPFIGNAGPSPAHTGIIDYLFNTAAPVVPEDPVVNTIPVNIVGNGRVDKSCGSPLTLQAIPELGWNFSNWSGDLTGTQNPGSLPITGSEVVTATFTPKPLALNVQPNGGGTVRLSPDQIYFDNGDVVTLTAIPNRGWVFDSWSGDLSGTEVSKVLTMDSNKTVTANFRLLQDKSNIESDDFNACTLNNTRWSYTNPLNDAELMMTGSQVKITVPAGVEHDVWSSGNNAPRIMQTAANEDFSLEAKFESVIDKRYQLQGILIEQDSNNFLRINFQHNGSNTYIFAASFSNGNPRQRFVQSIPDGAPLYLRVVRSVHDWGVFYSDNGEDWNTNSTLAFNFVMNVTKVGAFIGNAGTDAPAHTGVIDYFFNSASPLAPEDPVVNALPPITVVGQGTVTRSPSCGNPIQLTAVPAANWRFAGWSGDLTGSQSPVTVTAKGTERITATFAPISGIQSDDFSGCALNTAWTFIDPKDDAVLTRIDNQKISIALPAGVEHDAYPSTDPNALVNRAPRLMQPATDVDFELEAKFESAMAERFQMQGILIEQDSRNFLRFDYSHNGTTYALTAIGVIDGTPTTYGQEEFATTVPMYLRVKRTGDGWTVDRSTNGTAWTTSLTLNHEMTVKQVGIFAGNAGRNPAHTVIVDYFFENRNRINPEDAGGNQLTVTTNGSGTVNRTPNDTNYNCGERVQLQAVADNNWVFTGWSGGLSGSQNPATVTMDGSKSVTAIFKEKKLTLTLSKEGGQGSDDPGTTTASVSGPYYEGQPVKLSATPKSGYRFVKWVSGSTEYAEAEIDITVSVNTTFTAVFEKLVEAPTAHKIYMPIIAR